MTNQSQESVYNDDMMELIFGEFENEQYFSEERELPTGVYRPARTIRKGSMKFFSLSYQVGEWDTDEFWMHSIENGVDKVSYSYSDYVSVPNHVFIGEMVLFLSWIVATFFSLICLVGKGIGWAINKIRRRKRTGQLLRKWSTLSCVLQIVLLMILLAIMVQVSVYATSDSYCWMFALCGVIAIVMSGLVIYGVRNIVKMPGSRMRKVYCATVVCGLIVTVVNVGYWELFMFWGV